MTHYVRRSALLMISGLLLGGCTRTEGGGNGGTAATSASGSAGSGAAPSKESKSLTVKGSDTMVILGQKWAETYMGAHPGVSIQVTGGGSGTGIAALINGSTDLCDASRSMKDKEKDEVQAKRGAPAVETKVALDALAIYVNEKSPVNELDLEQIGKIYKDEITNWKDVGGKSHKITLYGRENNSGTYGYFKEHILEGKDFAADTQTLAGTSAVVNAVKGDEFGIGYGGIAYASGIKLLKVKKTKDAPAVEPKLETAKDGSYPISRFLFIYTAGAPQGLSKDYIDWIVSDAGQKVVSDVGYFPLPK